MVADTPLQEATREITTMVHECKKAVKLLVKLAKALKSAYSNTVITVVYIVI